MLELANPYDYDPALKKWDEKALPIILDEWKLHPRKGVAKQLNVIKKQLKKTAVIVNVDDPDAKVSCSSMKCSRAF